MRRYFQPVLPEKGREHLVYALGRSVQLFDKTLLESMPLHIKANDYRISTAIEEIVRSPRFREVRGRDYVTGN